jgi:MtN3 and saliva related transmembrane protein
MHYLGFLAGILTSGAVIPQLLKTYRTKHARDLSIWQLVLLNFGMLLWLLYGISLQDFPLIVANGFSIVCYSALILLKLRYTAKDAACGGVD